MSSKRLYQCLSCEGAGGEGQGSTFEWNVFHLFSSVDAKVYV